MNVSLNSPEITTPSFLVERSVVQRNCDAMREKARQSGTTFRPHMKTHKTLEIARMQFGGGAGPITVSTLAEAEFFAGHGFTSGGTEADNLGIFGLVRRDDHVITSTIEHSAVMNTCKRLEQMGHDVTYLPVNGRGEVEPEELRKAIQSNTRLISIMMANNETGVLQPVEEIGRIAREADIFFHTDAVQAAGKVPIDVQKIGCDALSISGHKIHGPQGTGALFVKRGTLIQPLLYGGNHERQRRAGTENLPGIVGLGKAADIARHWLEHNGPAEMAAIRDSLENAILNAMDGAGVNGAGALRVPNTSSIYFDHVEGEALVIALDLKGLSVSSGAACSSGAIEPSHVLLAMGLSHERARGSLRISLGKQTTQDEVDFAVQVVPQTVARLRELSPVYQKAVG